MAEFKGYYRVIFSRHPDSPHGDTQFIELEDNQGRGVGAHEKGGGWTDEDENGLVSLVIPLHPAFAAMHKRLEDAFKALSTLPEDALGYAEDAHASWPLKDELMHHISDALKEVEKSGVLDA